MNALERKKLEAQLARIAANRLDFEVKLEELKAAQERIQGEIAICDKAETEIKQKLSE